MYGFTGVEQSVTIGKRLFSALYHKHCCVYFNVETQWEKPDALQQANTTEQTAASSEEQTAYLQASTGASSEGDTTIAGVKRSSGDDNGDIDGGSEVKKPYDGRGYCRGGAYGSWSVVTVR